MKLVPFAQFRFAGRVVKMTADQFQAAVDYGKICRCGACLACRATEYARDALTQELADVPIEKRIEYVRRRSVIDRLVTQHRAATDPEVREELGSRIAWAVNAQRRLLGRPELEGA